MMLENEHDAVAPHRVAILLPAYNEASSLATLLGQLKKHALNIVVVDDGSIDETSSIANSYAVCVIKNKVNQGKGYSLQKGFEYLLAQNVSGIITMDADGQHAPADILVFNKAIKTNPNVIVIGTRHTKHQHAPKLRLLANWCVDKILAHILKQPIQDSQSGFRYYPIAFLKTLPKNKQVRFSYETTLIAEAVAQGFLINHVNIQCHYKPSLRKSYYRPYMDSYDIGKVLIQYYIKFWRLPNTSIKTDESRRG